MIVKGDYGEWYFTATKNSKYYVEFNLQNFELLFLHCENNPIFIFQVNGSVFQEYFEFINIRKLFCLSLLTNVIYPFLML